MQIRGLHAQHFLSLADLHWGDVDPGLNVLVGPNGSGKTNILRAVGLVVEALSWAKPAQKVADPFRPEDYLALGNREGWYDISVDVVFNTQVERDLLTAYFQAAMLDTDTIQRLVDRPGGERQITPERLRSLAESVFRAVTPDQLEPMFHGRLGVRCWARGGSEYLSYFAFGKSGTERYILLGPSAAGIITTCVPARPLHSYGSHSLIWLYWSSLSQDQRKAIRGFLLEESEDVTLPQLDLDSLSAQLTPAAMGNLELNSPPSDGTVAIPYELLLEKLGVSRQSGFRPSLATVMGRILEEALFRTDNMRIRPKRTYPLGDFRTRSVELSSGEDLALHLFRLKNGTANQRLSFGRIQRSFRWLMPGSRFDVRTVLSPSLDDTRSGDSTDETDITLQIVIGNKVGDVPLEASGAGMLEAVYLATVLNFAEDRILMLDEPALNLHPAIQRRLLRRILERTAQTIVVTHSPYLVPTHRLQNVRRAAIRNQATKLSPRFTQLLRPSYAIQLPRVLERSRDAVAALFATCVVLVDGPAEVAALPHWFEQHTRGKVVEDFGVEICPIHGKNNLGLYVAYLTAFGVPLVAMVDGDALKPDVGNVVRQFGYAGVQLPELTGFDEQKAELKKYNVFVMGSATTESFDKEFINIHAEAAPREVPDHGPALAFWVAENRPCPPDIGEVFDVLTVLARRNQR